ncbi:Signal transduction histidine kinase [Actinoalloteichus cyanogriseus DSM 43889]|uniref:histidine kinase n=1 Tax=Actinoalloteichus caeruleus DSM 43889 TaxID=1120930 RepID=A0ABT1JMQ9_ACTCY|nr:Signal transduction histidine kinase [Actinoalloteichus caeruleus DSM 43889]
MRNSGGRRGPAGGRPALAPTRRVRWWTRALTAAGARTPVARDAVVALGLALLLVVVRVGAALAVNGGILPEPLWTVVLMNLVASADVAVLAIRRLVPRTALVLATVVVLVASLPPFVYPGTGLGLVVCAYTVGSLLPRRRVVLTLAVLALVHAVGGLLSVAVLDGRITPLPTFWGNDGTNARNLLLASLFSYGLAGLLGLYTRTRRDYLDELAARVDRLTAERAERAKAAVREERARIARELHDVAAHDLSAIVVQAGAADRLVDRDPALVREALRGIRGQGRATLSAMRQLVGILRTDAPEDDQGPLPSMGSVEELVEEARRAGTVVTLSVSGPEQPLPVAVDVAAYRLVQEAISNARQHSPGAEVAVVVVRSPEGLEVAVRNGAATTGGDATGSGGYGLMGMRERVRQTSGRLRVGPTADGGWLVTAWFPTEPEGRE